MRSLRKLWWPCMSRSLVWHLEKVGNIFSYPVIFWVTFFGKDIYISGGWKSFRVAYEAEVDRLGKVLISSITPDHLKPINERLGSKSMAIKYLQQERNDKQRQIDQLDRLLDAVVFKDDTATLSLPSRHKP